MQIHESKGSSGKCVHDPPTTRFVSSWQTAACAEILDLPRVAIGLFTVCQLGRRVSSTDIDRLHALTGRTKNAHVNKKALVGDRAQRSRSILPPSNGIATPTAVAIRMNQPPRLFMALPARR